MNFKFTKRKVLFSIAIGIIVAFIIYFFYFQPFNYKCWDCSSETYAISKAEFTKDSYIGSFLYGLYSFVLFFLIYSLIQRKESKE